MTMSFVEARIITTSMCLQRHPGLSLVMIYWYCYTLLKNNCSIRCRRLHRSSPAEDACRRGGHRRRET